VFLRAWEPDTDEVLRRNFEQDLKWWRLRQSDNITGLGKSDPPDEYNTVIAKLRDKQSLLMQGHKFLISRSKNYPLLSFQDIYDWLSKDLSLLDDTFTKKIITELFNSCKQGRWRMSKAEAQDGSKKVRGYSFIARTDKAKKQKLKGPPEFDLTRFQWYELIVKVAATKYKLSGTKGLQSGFFMPPSDCLEKFFSSVYQPWLQLTNSTHVLSPLQAKHFIRTELLSNKLVNHQLLKN
jgi:hypothetical protein